MPLPFTKDLTMWSPISLYENTTYFSNFYLDQPSGDNIINEPLMVDLDPFTKFHKMHDFTTSMTHHNKNMCYLCTVTSANQRPLRASPSVAALKSTTAAAAASAIPFSFKRRPYQKNTKAAAAAQATPSPSHFRDYHPVPKAMRWMGRTSPALSLPTQHRHRYVPQYTITTPKRCPSSLFSHCTSTLTYSCSCSFFQKCWLWWKSILKLKKKYIHPFHKRKH